jgi:hypothetical protein
MFDEHPSTTMYTGGILIVLAGIGISWYEKIEHKRATTALINSA